jgi:catechol 2,3-dioxygenase-like lactoylglutathione lyase family enzyme
MPDTNGKAREAVDALHAHNLSPSFTVNDLQKSLRFYTDGLGFGIESQDESEGQIRFAMLRAGAVTLGLSQDDFAKGRHRVKGVGMRVWISTTQELAGIAIRLRHAGFPADDPGPLPWGPMAFAVTDPDGFMITIVNDS